MAKDTMTTDQADENNKPVAPDDLPAVDDDMDDPRPDQRNDPDPEDNEPRRAAREVESADDNPRERAVRRYREQRDRDEAAARAAKQAKQPPPEDIEPVDDRDDGAQDGDAEDNNQGTEREAAKPVRKFKLKVHGKEEEVPEEEVISLAQIAKASHNIIDVAKSQKEEAARLLKEVREAHEAMQRLRDGSEHPPARQAAKPDPSREQSEPEHQPVAGLDRERLRQITERIQVGDADEGAQALTDLVEEITAKVTPKVDPNEIERVVHRTTAQTRTQAELDAALESFASKYPDIAKDELLADAGKTVLRKEIIKDLQSVGIDEETISSIARDEKLLVQAHKDLRAANKGVRSYGDLLETTGKTLSDRFGIKSASPQPAIKTAPQRAPSDQDRIQDRVDRKRAAPQQPRAVGVRQQVAQPPQPQTARDVVRAMRRGRGFSVSD